MTADPAILAKIQQRATIIRQEFKAQLNELHRQQQAKIALPNQPAPQLSNPMEVSHVFLINKIAALQIIVERQQQQITQLLAARATEGNGEPP